MQTLKVHFVRDANDPLHWAVEVRNALDVVVGSGTLVFNADGTPAADNAPIAVTVTPENLSPFTFTLNMGEAGKYAGVTSLLNNATSQVQLLRQDGKQFGTLTATNFDERGNLEVTYSNGEKKKIGRLVLARFDSSGDLSALGDGLYVTQQGRNPQLSAGLEFGLGRVTGGNLELSNVELTEQFTDLIIIQRGYQASSQMTSVANEMLQQLLSMQDRR
jgi:flagellar hook protein FlgE